MKIDRVSKTHSIKKRSIVYPVKSRYINHLLLILVVIVEIIIISALLLTIWNRFVSTMNPFSPAANTIFNNNAPRYKSEFVVGNEDFPYVELKKNFTQKFDGEVARLPVVTTITINKDGFRDDKEFPLPKQKGIKRILVLGDSYTFGWGVELNQSWPKLLGQMLNNISPDVKYEVLNFGVPSYNTAQEINLYFTKGAKYDPDIIIIGFLSNDLLNHTEEEEFVRNSTADTDLTAMSEAEIMKKNWDSRAKFQDMHLKDMVTYWDNIENPLRELKSSLKSQQQVVLINLLNPEEFGDMLKSTAEGLEWSYVDVRVPVGHIHPLDHHPDLITHENIAKDILIKLPAEISSLDIFDNADLVCGQDGNCYMDLGKEASMHLPDLSKSVENCMKIKNFGSELCIFSLAIATGEEYSSDPQQVNLFCAKFDPKYRSNCFNKASWDYSTKMNASVNAIGSYCSKIDPDYFSECYNGFGDAVGQITDGDLDRGKDICFQLDMNISSSCMRGVGFSVGEHKKDNLTFLEGLSFPTFDMLDSFLNGLGGNLIERHDHDFKSVAKIIGKIENQTIRESLVSGMGNSLAWYYSEDKSKISECDNIDRKELVPICKSAYARAVANQNIENAQAAKECDQLPEYEKDCYEVLGLDPTD